MPETNRHLEIRTALYLILKREFAARATIGSEQFVYWDPTTSKKRLAPDAFVRLGAPHEPFRTWKTWKRGAPDLGVEVVSRSDEAEEDWNAKLARYRMAGIGEVVRFDAEDRETPIRIWDLIEGDMVERASNDPDLFACEALGLWWTVVEHPAIGPMLRLARDREGHDLLPTPDEAEASARAESAKAHEESAKARAESAKAREESTKARAESTKAREESAKVREDNARLAAELAALRAQLKGG